MYFFSLVYIESGSKLNVTKCELKYKDWKHAEIWKNTEKKNQINSK